MPQGTIISRTTNAITLKVPYDATVDTYIIYSSSVGPNVDWAMALVLEGVANPGDTGGFAIFPTFTDAQLGVVNPNRDHYIRIGTTKSGVNTTLFAADSLKIPALAAVDSGSSHEWELDYFIEFLTTTPNDPTDVDTGKTYDPNYEYIFAMYAHSKITANISDHSTIKILQVIPTKSLVITPTLGAGIDEVGGGVPALKAFAPYDGEMIVDPSSKRCYAYIPPGGAALVAGIGSVVWGDFTNPEMVNVAGWENMLTNFSIQSNGAITKSFGHHGQLGSIAMHGVIARRRVL